MQFDIYFAIDPMYVDWKHGDERVPNNGSAPRTKSLVCMGNQSGDKLPTQETKISGSSGCDGSHQDWNVYSFNLYNVAESSTRNQIFKAIV